MFFGTCLDLFPNFLEKKFFLTFFVHCGDSFLVRMNLQWGFFLKTHTFRWKLIFVKNIHEMYGRCLLNKNQSRNGFLKKKQFWRISKLKTGEKKRLGFSCFHAAAALVVRRHGPDVIPYHRLQRPPFLRRGGGRRMRRQLTWASVFRRNSRRLWRFGPATVASVVLRLRGTVATPSWWPIPIIITSHKGL